MHNKEEEVEDVKKELNDEELHMLAKKFADSLGRLLISFIIIFLSPYVVSLMWKWFVVSLGVPKIGYWHAFGLVLLVDFLTYKVTNTKDVTNKQILQVLGYVLFTWLIAFGISFLV